MRDKDFDVKAFPNLFPTGKYGIHYPRVVPLSDQQFYNQRLFNKDMRFSKEVSYVMMAQQHDERKRLESQINISAQKGMRHSSGVTQIKDYFHVFTKVRGTSKYWQQMRNELFAKIEQLGPFHIFFTLSCGELRWSEVHLSLLRELEGIDITYGSENEAWDGKDSSIFINGQKFSDYLRDNIDTSNLLRDNVVHITRMFDSRVKSFMKNIFMGSGRGKIPFVHFTYRVEFQARGMPHIHGVAWIEPATLEKYTMSDTFEFTDNVTELIDSLMTCHLPDENDELYETVSSVQKHNHTKSCRKKGGSCRFSFPRFPSERTIIAKPIDPNIDEKEKKSVTKKVTEVLSKARAYLESNVSNENMTIDDFLSQVGVSKEEYYQALSFSLQGTVIIHKRRVCERYINNYNPEFLQAWNANMDIQFCSSPHAVATYMTDYVTKDETGMSEVLKEALRVNKDKTNSEIARALKVAYLTHRQVSLSEATYRICPSMKMKDSTVKTSFIGTGFPENRQVFFQKVFDDAEPEGIEDDELEDELVELEGKSGKYREAISIHKRYAARPFGIQSISLAQYASVYEARRNIPKKTEIVDGMSQERGQYVIFDTDIKLPKYLDLTKERLGYMGLRSSPCIIRFHSSQKKEGHEKYYAELLLYYPWKDESQDLYRSDSAMCQKLFLDEQETIAKNKKGIFPFSRVTEAVMELLEADELIRPAHMSDLLDAQSRQQDLDDQERGEDLHPSYAALDPSLLDDTVEKALDIGEDKSYKFREITVEEDDELRKMSRELVPEQRLVLNQILEYCKSVMKAKSSSVVPDQKLLIVHGGAGVGKSAVIRIIAKWAEKTLRKAGDHPNRPRVLITGPTGMACALIEGITIHSAFNLKFGCAYQPLGDKQLDEYRSNLSDLKLLIIDEISMVTPDQLYTIHRRLCDIFVSQDPFANLSVVLVGDLMQLPPVQGRYIFERPISDQYKAYYDITDLWQLFVPIVLQHNHRQGESGEWADTLNRIRVGEMTPDDIALLRSRIVPEDEIVDENCVHIYYLNADVMKYNLEMLSKMPGDEVILPATFQGPPGYNKTVTPHGTIDQTQFMDKLSLKMGARVMLIANVNTCDNLVNGVMGKVIGFEYFSNGQMECIIVRFDSDSVGIQHRIKHRRISQKYATENGTPIFFHEQEYSIGGKRKQHFAKAKITQFPLKLSWANTAHKMQGQTIKRGSKVVIHWPSRLTNGIAYVMLGRSERLEDVIITGNFTPSKITCSSIAKKESQRLLDRALNNKSNNLLWWEMPSARNEIIVFSLNIRSLRKHIDDIRCDHVAMNSDIICLQETWLPKFGYKGDLEVQGYTNYFTSLGKGKGVAIYIRSQHNVIQAFVRAYEGMQYQVVDTKTIRIINIYRESHNTVQIKKMTEDIKPYITHDKPIIVVGDFNAPGDEQYSQLLGFMTENNLYQWVDGPTHIQGGTLDLIFTSTDCNLVHHYPYYSDHDALCCKIAV